jgi:hypothetical protein
MPEPSILDERLADIDRRLRMIQSGLEPVPAGEPPPTVETPARAGTLHTATPADSPSWRGRAPVPPSAPAPAPAPAPTATETELAALTARLRELTATQERLLAATQDLLVEHADVLSRVAPTLGVSAGPFTDMATLREFEQALAGLPRVREVGVREYAGSERAVLDVHLWPRTS